MKIKSSATVSRPSRACGAKLSRITLLAVMGVTGFSCGTNSGDSSTTDDPDESESTGSDAGDSSNSDEGEVSTSDTSASTSSGTTDTEPSNTDGDSSDETGETSENPEGTTPLEWTRIIPTDNAADEDFIYSAMNDFFATRADTLLGHTGLQYRSTDRGQTWSPVMLDLGDRESVENVVLRVWAQLASGRLFATTQPETGMVLTSTDDGATWTPCLFDTATDVKEIVDLSVTEPDKVAVLSERYDSPAGIFVSRDGGEKFDEVAWGRPLNGGRGVVFDSHSTLHVVNADQAYRSRDGGLSWYSAGKLDADRLRSLRDGTLLGISGFFTSSDYGDSWASGDSTVVSIVLLGHDEHLFTVSYDELRRSVDRGKSFQMFSLPNPADVGDEAKWTTLAQLSDGSLVLNGNNVDTEFGVPYLFISAPLPVTTNVDLLPADERPESCYDGTQSGDEEQVDCGGICGICEQWAQRYNETRVPRGMTANGTLLAHDGNDNLRSTDAGRTWDAVSPTYPKLRVVANHEDTVYAVDDANGIYLSTDDGATFTVRDGAVLPGSWLRIYNTESLWSNTPDVSDYSFSTDGGITWAQVLNYGNAALPVWFDSMGVPFTVDMRGVNRLSDDHTMFEDAVIWPAPVPISADGALASVQVGTTLYFWEASSFDDVQPLFRSEEPFETYAEVAPLPADPGNLVVDTEGRLVLSTPSGVYFSKDEGATWQERKNGLTIYNTVLLGITPSNQVVVTEDVTTGHDFYVSVPTSRW